MPNSSQWLLWTNQDRLETISAWLILAIAISGTLHLLDRFFSKRCNSIFTLAFLLISFFFAAAPFLRNPFIISNLEKYPYHLYIALMLLTLLIILIYLALKYDSISLVAIRKILQILSPLGIVFLTFVITANVSPISNEILNQPIDFKNPNLQPKKQKKLTVILLFDELSIDYLYGSKKIDLNPYPSLKKLMETSNKFTNANLPGGKTNVAVTELMTRRVGEVTLEELLENGGKKSKVMGWYIDYCNRFRLKHTDCTTVSNYNARTLDDHISILHPFLTNFNVLPYKNPYGYIKIPVAVNTHRRTFMKISKWLTQQMDNPDSDIIYAHFNLPHAPAIDEILTGGDNQKIFDTTEYSYLLQFKYIDAELEKIEGKIKALSKNREVDLVILSDHNARALSKLDQHNNIVLIYQPSIGIIIPKKELGEKIHPSEFLIPLINKNTN